MRIIVTGLVALHPVGGVAWDYLQYAVGFARLGHDVYYHEDTWSWPYHPLKKRQTEDGVYSAQFIKSFFDYYAPELADRWHYCHLHEISFGMTKADFEKVARTADMFVNVSGACFIPDSLSPNCLKVFIDTDPGYNQIVMVERPTWSENVERWCRSIHEHDVQFTYAENMGGEDCLIPDAGYQWRKTRMPVVLDLWSDLVHRRPGKNASWTTVMTWNAFKGPLVHKGVEYRSKGAEFEKFMELPRHVDAPMKVAVGGINAPLEELQKYGWQAVDGPAATLQPETYKQFIGDSTAEFSTAKQVYVATRSGWFSCRSACYLAAGRPVVVQDTGFRRALPCGEGVVAFSSMEEAVAGVESVQIQYKRHAEAARAIAEEYFDSDKVITDLLEQSAATRN